jgi:hypothetical protein
MRCCTAQVPVANGTTRTVARRYNQFADFHENKLCRVLSDKQLAAIGEFPGKRFFGSSTEPAFVEERKKGLQAWLTAVVALINEHPRLQPALEEFLCPADVLENEMLIFRKAKPPAIRVGCCRLL